MSTLLVTALLTLEGTLVGVLASLITARATRRDNLRLAAVDKRLAVHQEAFSLWSKLMSNLHQPDHLNEIVVECERWWKSNCLYLDPKSRRLFREGTIDAGMYHDLKGVRDPRETFGRLIYVFEALTAGVGLPTIGEHEWASATSAGAKE